MRTRIHVFGVPSNKPQSKTNFTHCKTWANTYIHSIPAYLRAFEHDAHTNIHTPTPTPTCTNTPFHVHNKLLEGCFVVISKLNIYINLMNPKQGEPILQWSCWYISNRAYTYIARTCRVYVCIPTICMPISHALFMPLDPNSDAVFRGFLLESWFINRDTCTYIFLSDLCSCTHFDYSLRCQQILKISFKTLSNLNRTSCADEIPPWTEYSGYNCLIHSPRECPARAYLALLHSRLHFHFGASSSPSNPCRFKGHTQSIHTPSIISCWWIQFRAALAKATNNM